MTYCAAPLQAVKFPPALTLQSRNTPMRFSHTGRDEPPNLIIEKGSVSAATAQYILNLCACEDDRPRGIARSVINRYPWANPYIDVRSGHKQRPGTIRLHPTPSSIERPSTVISIFGYIHSGRPTGDETFRSRVVWFGNALWQVAQVPDVRHVALAWRVGCTDADGGDWRVYYSVIASFCRDNPHIKVSVCRLES